MATFHQCQKRHEDPTVKEVDADRAVFDLASQFWLLAIKNL